MKSYLAKQMSGAIVRTMESTFYDKLSEQIYIIDFLRNFCLRDELGNSYLEGQYLDQLGQVLGLPRPYTSLADLENKFLVSEEENRPSNPADPDNIWLGAHALSDVRNRPDSASDDTKGGHLTGEATASDYVPVNDNTYAKYLEQAVACRRNQDIITLGKLVGSFLPSQQHFSIEFLEDADWEGQHIKSCDLLIYVSDRYINLVSFLQRAVNSVFVTSPKVYVSAKRFTSIDEIAFDSEGVLITGTKSESTASFTDDNTATLQSPTWQFDTPNDGIETSGQI